MEAHADQPVYHLYDPNGWVNDPNGPLYFKGQYHMFFQNVTDSTKWTWGLSWGHATSTDLLHWKQLPPALTPDPGWFDADGCFSGCATVDADGVPAILYTGVAKKPDAGEREGMPLTVANMCYERQLIARPTDPDDPELKEWAKAPQPFLADDGSGLPLLCFRDPFLLERPSSDNGWHWRVMIGSNIDMEALAAQAAADPHQQPAAAAAAGPEAKGILSRADQERQQLRRTATALAAAGWVGRGQGLPGGLTLGTATVYRSKGRELDGGWEYEGLLCMAKPGEGAIWECPILAPLHPPPAAAAGVPGAAAHPASPVLPAAVGPPNLHGVAAPGVPGSGLGKLQQAVVAATASQQQQQQPEAQRAMSSCLGLCGELPARPDGSAADSAAASPPSSKQQQLQQRAAPSHVFSVSCGVCPAIYWLGHYADGRFDLDSADGPHALDLGDVLYAPNLLEDAKGRQVIWSWLQEHPSPSSHDYAGCISLPRQLQLGARRRKMPTAGGSSNTSSPRSSLHGGSHLPAGLGSPTQRGRQQAAAAAAAAGGGGGSGCGPRDGSSSSGSAGSLEYLLVQTPLPELEALRSGRGLRLRGVRLAPGKPWSVPSQVSASHLDLTLTVCPTPGTQRFQLLLGPLRQEGEQQQQQQAVLPGITSLDLGGSRSIAGAPSGADELSAAADTTVAGQAATAAVRAPAAPAVPVQAPPGAAAPLSFVPLAGPAAASAVAEAAATAFNTTSPAALSGSLLPPAPGHVLAAPQPASAAGSSSSSMLPGAAGLPGFVGPTSVGAASSAAPFAAQPESPFPDSPSSQEAVLPAVLPLLPPFTGSSVSCPGPGIATATAASSSAVGLQVDAASSCSSSNPAATSSPFAAFAASPAAGSSSAASPEAATATAAAAAAGPAIELSEQHNAAALAAAAAAEQVAQEHHQAAAITYEFGSAQLQVLVGPPGPLLRLLKRQQEDLAAATATALGSPAAAAPAAAAPAFSGAREHMAAAIAAATGVGVGATTSSSAARTGTPTADTLGFEPPTLPPAPSGALTDIMAEAQAAGVRVLSCELRQLDDQEPLHMRLLLDYSILELFFGTGEVLTTRVYRGAPTARAAEVAMKKSAAHAASEAVATDAELASMGSLANLGLMLQQHHYHHLLMRSGSGHRLLGAHSSSLHQAGVGVSSPSGLPGVSGFASPQLSGSPRLGSAHVRTPGGRVLTGSCDSLTEPAAPGAAAPESPSEWHSHNRHAAVASGTPPGMRPGLMGADDSSVLPRLPFSPATAALGSYIHYFSPGRSMHAHVRATRHALSLPTLAGISEAPGGQPEATAAGGGVGSEAARISSAAAGLFGLNNSTATAPAGGDAAAAGAGAADATARRGQPRQLFREPEQVDAGGRAADEQAFLGQFHDARGSATSASASSINRASTGSESADDSESIIDSFPGFSPHKPPAHPNYFMSGGPGAAAAAERHATGKAESAGLGGSTSTKLASWFTKLSLKSSKGRSGKGSKGGKGDGSSNSCTSKVVVPPTFGVPVPSQLTPAVAGAAAAVAAVVTDASSSSAAAAGGAVLGAAATRDAMPKDQQEATSGKGSAAEKAPGSTTTTSNNSTQPKLPVETDLPKIRTSSSRQPSVKTQATGLSSGQQGPAGSDAACGPGAAAAGSALSGSPGSAKAGSGGSSPFAAARSPGRNWRATFVLPDIDDDGDDNGGGGGGGGGDKDGQGPGTSSSSSSSTGVLGARVAGLGLWGGLRLRPGPGPDPLVAEYGMYAKVCSFGTAGPVAAAAIAGAPAGAGTGGFGVDGKHTAAGRTASSQAGQAVARLAAGGAAAAGLGKQQLSSGYIPGAMRELSLVALGGGGAVLRLEAYEMASIWDTE